MRGVEIKNPARIPYQARKSPQQRRVGSGKQLSARGLPRKNKNRFNKNDAAKKKHQKRKFINEELNAQSY